MFSVQINPKCSDAYNLIGTRLNFKKFDYKNKFIAIKKHSMNIISLDISGVAEIDMIDLKDILKKLQNSNLLKHLNIQNEIQEKDFKGNLSEYI